MGKKLFIVFFFVLVGLGSQAEDAKTDETKQLHEKLAAIEQQRSGGTENMLKLEQAALSLLSENSSQKDKSEVYATIAIMFANSGMRQPSKVVEYCEKALMDKTEVVKACQLYVYWGEALERLENRKGALVAYLKGLRLVDENQTAREVREVPPLEKYHYDGPKDEPGFQIMLDNRNKAAAARQKVMIQNELVNYRGIFTDKCVSLYSEGSNNIMEFKDTARGILKNVDLLNELIEKIRKKQKEKSK